LVSKEGEADRTISAVFVLTRIMQLMVLGCLHSHSLLPSITWVCTYDYQTLLNHKNTALESLLFFRRQIFACSAYFICAQCRSKITYLLHL